MKRKVLYFATAIFCLYFGISFASSGPFDLNYIKEELRRVVDYKGLFNGDATYDAQLSLLIEKIPEYTYSIQNNEAVDINLYNYDKNTIEIQHKILDVLEKHIPEIKNEELENKIRAAISAVRVDLEKGPKVNNLKQSKLSEVFGVESDPSFAGISNEINKQANLRNYSNELSAILSQIYTRYNEEDIKIFLRVFNITINDQPIVFGSYETIKKLVSIAEDIKNGINNSSLLTNETYKVIDEKLDKIINKELIIYSGAPRNKTED